MSVQWNEGAERNREQIGDYIFERFGYTRLEKFIDEVDHTVSMILRNPNIGFIDPLFNDRPFTYRSIIINGLSKMVYRIDDDVLHIVAFWDTRQEPEAQASRTK